MGGSGLKVLKDLNFLNNGEKLNVFPHKREQVMTILEKDALFLSQNNLMDYSLLFIKAKLPERKSFQNNALERMPAMVYVK